MSASSSGIRRLYLLRHSTVASHRGDIPITDEGVRIANDVGRRLAASESRIRLLYGATLRARQTAEAIAEGAAAAGLEAGVPREAFALRNPDIYVAGVRVDMVSSPQAVAAQVDGLTADDAAAVPFFRGFLAASDRVGWWLRERDPPGEGAEAVAARILAFAASLADGGEAGAAATVAVTHSPILRACALSALGSDPGEPDWVSGLLAEVDGERTVRVSWLDRASLPEAPVAAGAAPRRREGGGTA